MAQTLHELWAYLELLYMRHQPTATMILYYTAVTAILDKTEYYVSENDGCVEVCVTLIGRYQRSVAVYLCIEGITALGIKPSSKSI